MYMYDISLSFVTMYSLQEVVFNVTLSIKFKSKDVLHLINCEIFLDLIKKKYKLKLFND